MPPPEPPAAARRFTISAADAGRRLDQYLASQLPELSRTRIQELIDEGHARVSGRPPRRAHRLAAGEVVDIEVLPRPPLAAAARGHSHRDPVRGPGLRRGEQARRHGRARRRRRPQRHAGQRPAPSPEDAFHRRRHAAPRHRPSPGPRHLRRSGRGAQRRRASRPGRAVPRAHRAENLLALLHGRLPRDSGVIALPIARDPQAPHAHDRAPAFRTRSQHRLARAAAHSEKFTLVAADLHTGRTHQIRAHFAAIGHPLAGDTLYGAPQRARAGSVLLPPLGRVFLHAARLAFAAPRDGRAVEVRAPLDPGLKAYLDELAAAVKVQPRQVDAALRGYL